MNPSDQNDPVSSEYDRGVAPVNGPQPQNMGKLFLMAAALVTLLLVIYLFPGSGSVGETTAPQKTSKRSTDAQYMQGSGNALGDPQRVATKPTMPIFTPPKIPTIEARTTAPITGQRDSGGPRVLTPDERRMQGSLTHRKVLTSRGNSAPSEQRSNDAIMGRLAQLGMNTPRSAITKDGKANPKQVASDPEGLSEQLKLTKVSGAKARRLSDMTTTIARGRLFECVLDTAISSAVAGQTRCTVPDDVYGEDGKVVLLDRGTEVIGEYKSNLADGSNRLGVLWNRAKTPTGVLIDLNSPAADGLGRGGVPGQVETFFWKRFGAAIMLSVLDDSLAAAVAVAKARAQEGGSNISISNTSSTGRDLAQIALERSINIRPILIKNQGESVSVFLARDLSFKDVYAHRQLGVR